jgi:hypothetical protein
MVRAFGGALSLALTILVFRLLMPDVASLISEILIKVLTIVNHGLDLTVSAYPQL